MLGHAFCICAEVVHHGKVDTFQRACCEHHAWHTCWPLQKVHLQGVAQHACLVSIACCQHSLSFRPLTASWEEQAPVQLRSASSKPYECFCTIQGSSSKP